MNIFSDNELNWLDNIEYTDNVNYELEIRFRIQNKSIYEKILHDFKKKDNNLKKHEKNIHDDIIYEDNFKNKFKIIKRKENNENEICYSKKTLKSRYLEDIPAIIFLCSERKYDIKIFNNKYKHHINKIQKKKKRISFFNEYISFDFTEYDKEYDIEIEILNPKRYKIKELQKIIRNDIETFLSILPDDIFVLHNVNKYKKYIKQPSPLKNKEDIKYKFGVTPKFDGLRCQLYIDNNNNVFIVSNNFKNIVRTKLLSNINNTLIDGELIHNKIFYAFDLIIYKNNKLIDKCIFERLNILKYDISIKNNNSDMLYEIKKYYFDDIYKDSKKIIKKEYNYIYNNNKQIIPKDGLIFIDVKNNYIDSIILKWKKEITFDFKIEKLKTYDKKEEWCLKCYDKENNYVVFKDKEYVNLDNAKEYKSEDIVEFKYNKSKDIFIPIKKRDDKELPNFIDIANDNMECLIKSIKF